MKPSPLRAMESIQRVFLRVYTGALGASAFVAKICLVAIVLLVTVDVCGRFLFNNPILGAFEITELLLVGVTFLAIGYVESRGGHAKVELFFNRFPTQTQTILSMLYCLIGVGVFSLITWQGFERAMIDARVGLTTQVLRIPIFPAKLIIPLASLLMSIQLLIVFFKRLSIVTKGGGKDVI